MPVRLAARESYLVLVRRDRKFEILIVLTSSHTFLKQNDERQITSKNWRSHSVCGPGGLRM
jgi:hypothetical protein